MTKAPAGTRVRSEGPADSMVSPRTTTVCPGKTRSESIGSVLTFLKTVTADCCALVARGFAATTSASGARMTWHARRNVTRCTMSVRRSATPCGRPGPRLAATYRGRPVAEAPDPAALREKAQELRIDPIRVRPQHAMRPTGQLHEFHARDHPALPPGCGVRRQIAIGVTVEDERRHVVLFEVLSKVLDPAVDARDGADRGGTNAHIPIVFEHAFADELPACDIVVVEVAQELHQKRRTVRTNGGLDPLEHLRIHTLRIVGCFHEVRAEGPDQDRLAHALAPILAEVSGDFARAHREPHERHLLQIELFQQLVEV